MSSIDSRIVDMQFNNGEFEKGIATSLKSLDKLKDGLDLEKSTKSLKKLQEVSDEFSLAAMAKSVDSIAKRFTAMGIAGVTAIQNISNSAINAGKQLVKSLTVDQLTAGFSKYEEKTTAVKTILSATGDTMEVVTKQLQKLNWFSDETSYNFVDMTSNIGKFTSAGVKLNVAVTAMQGIANWAALSGQNAQTASRAMYNLSQAIGAGVVKLMDWRSIENANMGTKEFKETVIQTAKELKVLSQAGKTKKGTLVTFQNFADTLSQGWFTSEVLLKALDKYGEYADEVFRVATENGISAAEAMERIGSTTGSLGERAFKAAQEAKTFTDAINATKDAVSTGWMNTFEILFGNYEEATELWTNLAGVLWDVFASGAEARNELLSSWKELGGREDLLKGITYTFEALQGIAMAVGEAMDSIFPPATVETLLSLSKGVKQFGQNLRSLLYYSTEYTTSFDTITKALSGEPTSTTSLKRGDKGDEVKELQRQLAEAGYAIEQDGVFGKKTEAALKRFQKDRQLIVDGIFGEETRKNLLEKLGITNKDGTVVEKIANTVRYFGDTLDRLKRIAAGGFAIFDIGFKILKAFGGIILIVADTLSPIADLFLGLLALLGDLFVGMDQGMDKALPFTDWLEILKSVLAPIKSWLKTVSDAILNFFTFDSKVDSVSDKLSSFAGVLQIIKEFLFGTNGDVMGFTTSKKGLFQKIGDFFNGITDWYSKSELAQTVMEKLENIVRTIKEVIFGTEEDSMGFSAGKPNIVQRLGDFFKGISEWYSKSEAAQSFAKKVGEIVRTIKEFIFGTEGDTMGFSSGKPNIIERLGEFFKGIADWYSKSEEAKAFVEGIKAIIQTIKEFIFGTEGDAMGFSAGKPNIIQRLGDFFEGIAEWYSKSETAQTFVKKLKEIVQNIKDFLFGTGDNKDGSSWTPNIIERIRDFFKGLSEWYSKSKMAQAFVQKIKDIIQTIKEFIFGTKGDKMGFTSGKPSIIKRVGDFLKGIADWYSKSEAAQKVVATIKDIFSTIVETLLSFFSVDAKAEVKDPTGKIDDIMDPMAEVGERLIAGWDKIVEIFGGVFKGVNDVLNFFGPTGLIAVVAAAFGGIAIYRLMGSLRGLFKAFSLLGEPLDGMFGSLKDMFSNAGDLIKDYGKNLKNPRKAMQPIALSILEFAAAIAILVGAVYVLGSMSEDQLKQGGIALGVLVGIIVLFAIMAKLMEKANAQKSFGTAGKAILNLAFSIGILTAVIYVLGVIPDDIMKKGSSHLIGLMGLITVFMIIMKHLGTTNVNYKGLISVSVAIGILAFIAWMLGNMDPIKLQNGILYLGGLMLILALFMVFVNNYGGSSTVKYQGLFGLSLALAVMVGLVKVLGDMDPTKVANGITALGAIMLFLGMLVVAINLSQKGSKVKIGGLIAIAFAISALVGSVMVLGGMNEEAMKRGVLAVVALMTALAVLMAAIGYLGKNINGQVITETIIIIVGLAALMYVFALVLDMIKDIDPNVIINFAAGLAIALATLVGAILVITKSKIGVGKMAQGAAGIGIAIGILVLILGGIVGGIGQLDVVTNGGVIEALNRGADALYLVGNALGRLVGGIRDGILGVNDLDSTNTELEIFNANLETFNTMLDKLAWAIGGFSAVLLLSAFIPSLSLVTGAFKVGLALIILAGAATTIVATLGWVNKDGWLSEKLVEGGNALYDLGIAIGKFVRGVKDGFTGVSDLETYTKNMEEYGKALGAFATNVGAIDQTAVDKAVQSSLLLAAFVEQAIPKIGGLKSWFEGETDWGGFSRDMILFSGALGVFTLAIKFMSWMQVSETEVTHATDLAQKLKDFFDGIKPYQVEVGQMTGYYTAPAQLSTDMKAFAEAIGYVRDNIKDLGNVFVMTANVFTAILMASIVHTFFSLLKPYQVATGQMKGYYSAPAQLSTDMGNFATAIKDFKDAISNLGDKTELETNTTNALDMTGEIHDFFLEVDDKTPNGDGLINYNSALTSLFFNMGQMADKIVEFKTKLQGIWKTSIYLDTLAALWTLNQVSGFLSNVPSLNIDEASVNGNLLGWLIPLEETKTESLFYYIGEISKRVSEYKTAVQGLTDTSIISDTTTAIAVLTSIATDFLTKVPELNIEQNKGAIQSWFSEETKAQTIISDFGKLGEALNLARPGFEGLADTTIVADALAAKEALTSIANFLQFVSNDIQLRGFNDASTDLPTFEILTDQMSNLATAIVDFQTETKGVDLGRFSTIAWGISAIGKAISSLSTDTESESFTSFQEAFNTIKDILSGTGEDGSKLDPSGLIAALDTTKIDEAFTTFVESVGVTMDNSTGSIRSYIDDFNGAGSELATSLNTGVSGVTDTSGIDKMVGALLSATNPYKEKFESVGKNFGLSMSAGLRKSAEVAVAMAEYVAKKMLEKVKEVFNINSPSREGISIGESLDEGLAMGVAHFTHVATKSAERMGSSVLDTTRDSISGISSLIDSNMESDPVIRPVLDLSNVTSGARSIAGMFSGRQALAVDSVYSKAMASSVRMPSPSSPTNQNGSTNVSSLATVPGSMFDFSNSQFVFKDQTDIRAFKLELESLDRDARRARGRLD